MTIMMRVFLPALLLLILTQAATAKSRSWLQKATTQGRRWLNLGGTFGSALNSATVYDRIAGHPVFAVTTPWGSPYMNMEKLDDTAETIPDQRSSIADSRSGKKKPTSSLEEQSEMRMVALYFVDPADALAMHGEMHQMENMKTADVRLTAFSLGKALRQASNLGPGLTTGQPPEPVTGIFPEHGTLRYKLVPSKKQLYYAARCTGRERVGLCSETPTQDAALAIVGNSALEAANLLRRRQKAERKFQRSSTSTTSVPHMEGYTGLPVFYCPQMHRRVSLLQRLWTGVKEEKPFFFNYEDLVTAWDGMVMAQQKRKKKKSAAAAVPPPPAVEVFNLWDVLSSMDRQQQQQQAGTQHRAWLARLVAWPGRPRRRRLSLQDITFVPNSDAVHYKDGVSRRGNGKARLKPMR